MTGTTSDYLVSLEDGPTLRIPLRSVWVPVDLDAPDLVGELGAAVVDAGVRFQADHPGEAILEEAERVASEVDAVADFAALIRDSTESAPEESVRLAAAEVLHPLSPATTVLVSLWTGDEQDDRLVYRDLLSAVWHDLPEDTRAVTALEELRSDERAVLVLAPVEPADVLFDEAIAIAVTWVGEIGLPVVVEARSRGPAAGVAVKAAERFALAVTIDSDETPADEPQRVPYLDRTGKDS